MHPPRPRGREWGEGKSERAKKRLTFLRPLLFFRPFRLSLAPLSAPGSPRMGLMLTDGTRNGKRFAYLKGLAGVYICSRPVMTMMMMTSMTMTMMKISIVVVEMVVVLTS